MGKKQTKKSCLIISYGPVPTPEYQTVEGGGMRAWGLAKGLVQHGLSVTVAVNNSFPQSLSEHQDVLLTNWSLDDSFISAINSFDTVIMSYCMGDPSVFVVDNIAPRVQLILDVYVPIYVEVSARDTDNMPREYAAYSQDIARHNKVLKRGDYFLCANEVQKIFYTGVLGSLGIINPLSYRQNRIRVVPFGIHRDPHDITEDPYEKLGIAKNEKRVLWFGGLYPWFRIEDLLEAIDVLANEDQHFRFILVGGKNPFNNNPDLLRQYEAAFKFAKERKLLNKQIFFVDWVDYEKRINWYAYADFVISLNQPGEESAFAWRTRVMDYIWGDIIALTNGGDPLGDELIANGAAIKLVDLRKDTIVNAIRAVYSDKAVLQEAKKSLKLIKEKYFWDNVTAQLIQLVSNHELKYQHEQDFILTHDIDLPDAHTLSTIDTKIRKKNVLTANARRAKSLMKRARSKGLRRSAMLGYTIAKNQFVKKTIRPRKFIFISHPIDHTGAPLVLLHIIDEVIEKYGARNIRIIAPFVEADILKNLRKKGVSVEKAAELNYRLAAAQLALEQDDFVLMNTVAIYDCYREVVLNMLQHNKLKNAHWFIHEDEAQLRVVKGVIEEPGTRNKISQLINSSKLHIFVPAKRVKLFYDKLFETNRVKAVPLKLEVPENLFSINRSSSDFDSVRFLLTGAASDGRKGQLIVLAAFQAFLLKYAVNNPSAYRDFEMHFISVGNDYVSTQVKTIGNAILGNKLHTYPALSRHKALEIAHRCNAVICSSLNETFGLYVAEGMLMGHVVLRNDSAGQEEQLSEGKNGFFIDSNDINQMAEVFERILNKNTTPNNAFLSMSRFSQKMMKPYATNIYLNHFVLGENLGKQS
jgi:glycosyltransferase involved in cell wall biosynthesis